jgi:diguanylate cyclase (GGDEF)-like protein/PAS domain S-box-containing protein
MAALSEQVPAGPLITAAGVLTPAIGALLARSLECMSSAIALIDLGDPAQPILYVNPAFERLTGYAPSEAVGRRWTMVEGPETAPDDAARMRAALADGHELRILVRHHRRDGTPYWSETFLTPVSDAGGAITHFVAIQKDVTGRVDAERRAAHLAHYDALTGLPNRTYLHEHLDRAILRASRDGSMLAMLFLDLDGFKAANDRHGHDAGDQVLQAAAARWANLRRDSDVLVRYGGDEFVVVVGDLDETTARGSGAIGERYAAALREPFIVAASDGEPIALSVSVGTAIYPDDGRSVAELLARADAAMYRAKRRRAAGTPGARDIAA